MENTIPHKVVDGYRVISRRTLKWLSPEAAASLPGEPIWVMFDIPECIVPYSDDLDGPAEEWTETNEPELAEWISGAWQDLAVKAPGGEVVILCRTLDDEYGSVWDESTKTWSEYMY